MMDEFLTQQKWYYMGPDETIYGPFSSHEMYVWLQHRYFNDNLQLKTDKDEQFYSLADWVQACGNQNPFLLPISSMESLLNDGNGMGVQRVPSVPVMGNGNCFSLSGTPSSTPTPAYGGGGNVFEPQHQPPLAGVPLQMVRASPPGPGGQIVFIPPPPAHGLFRPGNGQHPPTIFSPSNHPPPPFAMPQMPTIGAGSPFHPQQFVGSQRLENGGQGQPQLIQAPPLPAPAHPLHISLPYRPPASVLISQQHQRPPFGEATGKNNQKRQQETAPISSDSPDGGNMVTPYTQPPKIDKGLDTADAPWNKLVADKHVHKCVGPDMPMPAGQNSTGVQTDQIKISPSAAENHISQLLGGIRVVIQQPHPSLPQQKNHHHHKEKASAGQNNNSQNSNNK